MVVTYPTIAHDMVVPAKAYSNRDPRFLKKWRCEKIGVGGREEEGREREGKREGKREGRERERKREGREKKEREEGKKERREEMRGHNSEINAHRMTNLFTNYEQRLYTVHRHICLPFADYTLHRI